MELKDVLITLAEENKLWKKVGPKCVTYKIWAAEINKAQCLKLIEWGESWCTEHVIKTDTYDFNVPRFQCPECMAELEKQLKEG